MRRGGFTIAVILLFVLPGCGVQVGIGNDDARPASWLAELQEKIRDENAAASAAYRRMQDADSDAAVQSAARDSARSSRRLLNTIYSLPTPSGCQSIRDGMVHFLVDDLRTFRRLARGVGLDHRAKMIEDLRNEWKWVALDARRAISRGECA